MKKPTYDVDYFINKFANIPDKKWTILEYKNRNRRCCALGHCGVTTKRRTVEGEELQTLVRTFLTPLSYCAAFNATSVNDASHDGLAFGDTPKERILNALLLIKALKEEENV